MARILVIDDHPHIRDLFREALEHHGHIGGGRGRRGGGCALLPTGPR